MAAANDGLAHYRPLAAESKVQLVFKIVTGDGFSMDVKAFTDTAEAATPSIVTP